MDFAEKFGVLMACAEAGVAPESFSVARGLAKRAASHGAPGRLVIKAAADCLAATGYGRTAPHYHLHFLAKEAAWDRHGREVAILIARVVNALKPAEKRAFSDAVGGIGTLGRAGLYGSLGAGAGLGALYFALSRHAQQDDADVESMRHQADYYNQLGRELHDSMRRKYRYQDDEQDAQRKKPAERMAA